MGFFISFYEAQRQAALDSFGYYDETSATPNLSEAYEDVLLRGWVALGKQAMDAAPDDPIHLRWDALEAATRHIEEDQVGGQPPTTVWTHVFSLASLLDQGATAFPTTIQLAKSYTEDATAWLGTQMQAALTAAKPTLLGAGVLLVGLVVLGLYVVLKVKA